MAKKVLKKQLFPDIVYGVHAVIETFSAKRRKFGTLYTTKRPIKAWRKIERVKPSYVEVVFVSREYLDKLAGNTEHQNVIVTVSAFPFAKHIFTPQKQGFVVMLDEIQDVRNLGAILRSAYCTGVDGVILCRKNSAPLTPAAVKASAGLAEHLQIYIAATNKSAVTELKKSGYMLYCATLGQGENASKVEYTTPSVLLIGNEEVGISADVAKQGMRILLPQRRPDISYNASVAAGILMYTMGLSMAKI